MKSLLYRRLKVALINTSLDQPYRSYGDHWRDGFIDAGCDLTVYTYDKIPLIPPIYDLYFFVEVRYQISDIPWFLNPRVLYSWDSHIIGTDFFKDFQKGFDYILLASKIDVENLHDQGVKNVLWIPEACNPRIHKDLGLERIIKFGYIGNHNADRKRNGKSKDELLTSLKESKYGLYHKTGVFGKYYQAEQNKIKIMFDRTIAHNIGTRIFESSAAGCLPVWSKTSIKTGIDELLVDGAHYLSYDDTLEGLEKVLEMIYDDDPKIKQIANQAKNHVLNNHTYSHRVLDLFKQMGIGYFSIMET